MLNKWMKTDDWDMETWYEHFLAAAQSEDLAKVRDERFYDEWVFDFKKYEPFHNAIRQFNLAIADINAIPDYKIRQPREQVLADWNARIARGGRRSPEEELLRPHGRHMGQLQVLRSVEG